MKMQVWVIMGSDFPEDVCDSERAAEVYVNWKKEQAAKLKEQGLTGGNVYWRAVKFSLTSIADVKEKMNT